MPFSFLRACSQFQYPSIIGGVESEEPVERRIYRSVDELLVLSGKIKMLDK